MNGEQFSIWLHGWSEINGGGPPTPLQWQIINDHLDLVFNKVTPNRQVSATPAQTVISTVPPSQIVPNSFVPNGSAGVITIPNLNLPPGVICATSAQAGSPLTNVTPPAPALPDIKIVSGGPYFFTGSIFYGNTSMITC